MPDVRFDKFYRYEDLTRILHAYAEEFPQLVRLESIGKSYENRDIWLMTLTHFTTDSDREKPALWVDGNIHATELAPSTGIPSTILNWVLWNWVVGIPSTLGQIHLQSF